MKKKYKKQLEKNLSRQKDTVLYQMSESKSLANDLANSQLKMEVHNIKLHFLPNRSSREYMVKRNASESNLNETLRSSEGTQSDDMCQLRFEDNKNKLKEIEHHVQEPKPTAQNTALVPYDSSTLAFLLIFSIISLFLNKMYYCFRKCFLSASLDECFNGVQALDKSAWQW